MNLGVPLPGMNMGITSTLLANPNSVPGVSSKIKKTEKFKKKTRIIYFFCREILNKNFSIDFLEL
jgi:hypothetical protein